jgi:hypothetical protein
LGDNFPGARVYKSPSCQRPFLMAAAFAEEICRSSATEPFFCSGLVWYVLFESYARLRKH